MEDVGERGRQREREGQTGQSETDRRTQPEGQNGRGDGKEKEEKI